MQDLILPIIYSPQESLFFREMFSSWDLEMRIVDKWSSKPWMGQIGPAASLCVSVGSTPGS